MVQRRVGQHHAQLGQARARRRRRLVRPAGAGPARSAGGSRRAPPRRRRRARPDGGRRPGRGPSAQTACRRGPCAAAARRRRRRWWRRRPGGSHRGPSPPARRRRPGARRPRGRAAGPRPAAPRRVGRRSRGPHTGQALGWAWKRRSPGSSYSRLAVRAHGEAGHRGGRAVVGDRQHDGVAGPAVGAVREGVAVAAVGRVVHLGQAVVAGAGVDADRDVGGPSPSLARMAKARRPAPARRWWRPTPCTRARGGGASTRRRQSSAIASGAPCDLDQHAGAVVADEAGEAERHRLAVHEGAEPDTLDGAGHPQPAPLAAISRCGEGGRRRACRRCGSRRRR